MRHTYALALLVLFSACGPDPRTASTESFEQVLRRELPERPLCIRIAGTFPRTVPVSDVRSGDEWISGLLDGGASERIAAFAEAGLIEVTSERVETHDGYRREGERIYDLTATGHAAYRDSLHTASGRGAGFCMGEKDLLAVKRFTEPAEMLGMRLTQVEYTYQLDSLPAWGAHPSLQRAFPRETSEAARAAKEPVTATQELVLTSEGWVPADEVAGP